MMDVNIFKAVADLATGAKARQLKEYQGFLGFFRNIAESLSAQSAEMFGNMSVLVKKKDGSTYSPGIEISAADYIWWVREIEDNGSRFVKSIAAVEMDMLERLSKQAESTRLEPAERKALIALLEQARA